MSKVLSNVRDEAGYYEVVYSKLLEVRKRRKVTQGLCVKLLGSEGKVGYMETETLDERKQAEVVCASEWPRGFPGIHGANCEGVVQMGDSCDVPRAAGHGACADGAEVAYEVGDDQVHELLWEPGNWGRRWGRGISKEKQLDFGLSPPPGLGSERFKRYCGGNTTR